LRGKNIKLLCKPKIEKAKIKGFSIKCKEKIRQYFSLNIKKDLCIFALIFS